MADEGGVTLRIDANTAAYIAKLSELADSHEKVTKHLDGWGSAAEHAVGKLAAFIGPLALIGTAVKAVEVGFEAWKSHLESAGKTTQTLVDNLRRTTAQTGENRQAVEDQLTGIVTPQSVADRVAGFNAFRQNAPSSSTRIAPGEIARKLGQAEIAGYDPTQLAGIAGNVEGARSGSGSFDLAALLLSRIGSNADQASGLIRRLGEKAGPGGAQAALPYLLASSEAGDRRFSFLSDAENAYTPAQGDFATYMQRRLRTAKPDQRGLAASIQGRLAGAQRDIAGLPGFLEGRAQEALGDDSVRESEQNKVLRSQAEIEKYRRNKETEEGYARRDALRDLSSADDSVDAALGPNIHEAVQRATGKYRGEDYAAGKLGELAGSGGGTVRTNALIEEQNAIMRERRLRTDAHPDH